MIFQVSYELRTPNKDYSELYFFLENAENGVKGNGIHVLRDVWWVEVPENYKVQTLFAEIKNRLGDNDIFFLSELHKQTTSGWMPSSHWNWFNERMS